MKDSTPINRMPESRSPRVFASVTGIVAHSQAVYVAKREKCVLFTPHVTYLQGSFWLKRALETKRAALGVTDKLC